MQLCYILLSSLLLQFETIQATTPLTPAKQFMRRARKALLAGKSKGTSESNGMIT